MTKPVFTPISCSVCGRQVAKAKGVTVVLGVVCDDPLCEYQGPAPINVERDALVVAAALDKLPVSKTAAHLGISRQRAYQIFDKWKAGV